jgi:uncharacterized protein (TIGR00159 family)
VVEFLVELYELLASGVGAFFARSMADVLRDVLDISIVAAFIYALLVMLKGTRAMQMAIGLGLLLVGYAAARQFGLLTTWQILDKLTTYVVLIVVVIFQADIRRALTRVGSSQLFRGQRTAKETQVIEEVIKAACQLATKRIGALIVFERGTSLSEFMEEGTALDASVSKELLYTIFIPSFENPMHDGALVIRDGRVWQAGAFLPLAGAVDRTLGARHRAALGITQETDAVVVVVSEERGAISLCFDGNIVRNLDARSLRDALFGLFYRPTRNSRPPPPSSSRISLVGGEGTGTGSVPALEPRDGPPTVRTKAVHPEEPQS